MEKVKVKSLNKGKRLKKMSKGEEKEIIISLKIPRNPRSNRAERAVSYLKKSLERHLRKHLKEKGEEEEEEEKIKIDPALNEYLWKRGIRNIPRKVKVSVKLSKGKKEKEEEEGVTVKLAEK